MTRKTLLVCGQLYWLLGYIHFECGQYWLSEADTSQALELRKRAVESPIETAFAALEPVVPKDKRSHYLGLIAIIATPAPFLEHQLKSFDVHHERPDDWFRSVGWEVGCALWVLPRAGEFAILARQRRQRNMTFLP